MSISPTIAILAGGASRRLGQDKAALFLDDLLETLAPLGLRTLVVGRAGDDSRFVPDDFPGEGPLAGLATALRHAEGAPVLALACDLPLLSAEAVRWLCERTLSGADHGLIVRQTGHLEPLFSLYDPSCLPLALSRLSSGRRSLHGLIESGGFAFVDLPEEYALCLTNVNRPEDLQALLRR